MISITYSNLFIRFSLKTRTATQPRKELKDVILLRCNLTNLTLLISFQRQCSGSTALTIDFGMGGWGGGMERKKAPNVIKANGL